MPVSIKLTQQYKTLLLVVLLSLVKVSPLLAQRQLTKQGLYWLRYYNIVNFNKQWSWHNEFDTRHFFVNSRHHNFIMHTRLAYKPNDWLNLATALTYSLQRPHDPHTTPRPGIQEFRPWQEINLNQSLPRALVLSYRLRTEERFISTHTGHFDGSYNFLFRHRHRVQFAYPVKKWDVSFRISEEFFYYFTQGNPFNNWDQNRFYVSVDKKLSPSFAVELGYMNIRQAGRGTNQLLERNIARFTLYHSITLN